MTTSLWEGRHPSPAIRQTDRHPSPSTDVLRFERGPPVLRGPSHVPDGADTPKEPYQDERDVTRCSDSWGLVCVLEAKVEGGNERVAMV